MTILVHEQTPLQATTTMPSLNGASECVRACVRACSLTHSLTHSHSHSHSHSLTHTHTPLIPFSHPKALETNHRQALLQWFQEDRPRLAAVALPSLLFVVVVEEEKLKKRNPSRTFLIWKVII